MAVCKRLKWKDVPVYIAAQCVGAFIASLVIYGLFHNNIAAVEAAGNIVRGSAESVATAKMFGEYYVFANIPMGLAAAAEAFGTFILVFMIFGLTEDANVGRPDSSITPLFIGLTVTTCIAFIAPLTQAGLNPARDFIPRLVALIFGWGQAAFPDSTGGWFWVYILAPIVGAVVAGLFYTYVLETIMRKNKEMA